MSLDVGTEQNCSGAKISKEQKLYASLIVRESFGRLAQRVCHVLGLYGAVTFEELCENVIESRDAVLPGDATESSVTVLHGNGGRKYNYQSLTRH